MAKCASGLFAASVFRAEVAAMRIWSH